MLLTLFIITLLASISPGPDFIVVMRNALISRSSGVAAAIAIGFAELIHVTYCIAGLGIIISQSILLFQVIKIAGALYLLYLAYHLLRSKPADSLNIEKSGATTSLLRSFKEGFIGSVLNPKTTVFFLSVFSQVIDIHTPILTQIGYGIFMAIITAGWFIFLSLTVNLPIIRSRISSVTHRIEQVMGAVLAALGVKILFESK